MAVAIFINGGRLMNVFQGTGNLGSDPEKKMVEVQGEQRPVVTFRVFFAGAFKLHGLGRIRISSYKRSR